MPFHFACSQGHQWGACDGDDVPVGVLAESCPVCGSAGSIIPQLELREALDFSPGCAQVAAVCVEAPATMLVDIPRTLQRNKSKRGRKWRVGIGVILALTVVAGMVFSL